MCVNVFCFVGQPSGAIDFYFCPFLAHTPSPCFTSCFFVWFDLTIFVVTKFYTTPSPNNINVSAPKSTIRSSFL